MPADDHETPAAAAWKGAADTKADARDLARELADDLPGDTPAEKLDALHERHFAGTALTTHTYLWNLVHAFKEDVKKLLPKPKT